MSTAPGWNPSLATFPLQPFLGLDALWIQVAGSRCNLTCTHCFVSSGPEEDRHTMLSRAEVTMRVSEARALGVREIYFTGGEPFLHTEMVDILRDTLAVAPCTVLTNGLLLTPRRIGELRTLSDSSPYSLEIRVSFDGEDRTTHDAVRGPGTFDRAMTAMGRLSEAGLVPIATVTQLTEDDPDAFRERWIERLRGHGVARPRLKVLPLFHLGRETTRTHAYERSETLAGLSPEEFDPLRLQCGTSRAVTSRGVFVCPLLVDEDSARMGRRLTDAARAYPLQHGACLTCWSTGMTCANG